ncbi:MAG TPA: OsmC family protein [Capsulimonadaceae bacterium]
MPVRKAEATWKGDLPTGEGSMKLGSGAFEGPYSFKSRMQDGTGTNPEELIGAAHAGCYSMAFAFMLSNAGFKADSIHTKADVKFEPVEGGFAITGIHLTTEGVVPGIDAVKFEEIAKQAKEGCPVSKVLTGTTITLDAKLV